MEFRPRLRLREPLLFALALAWTGALASASGASVFGSVVSIGGSPSDIALDETRGLLYVAEFGGHVIDAVSTTDNTIHSSINVLPWPGAIALSFDAQYLLVAHYCNGQTTPACMNAVTSIHLADNSKQIFSLANAPLGIAFLGTGQALIITTGDVSLLDPSSGQIQLIETIGNIANSLPATLATFPGQIIQAALTTSADGSTVWGIASAGSAAQFVFQYGGSPASITAGVIASAPVLLPRVSSSADGSFAMIGYALVGPGGYLRGRYPNVTASTNITGVAVDSVKGLIYAQLPDMNQPTGPPTTLSGSATPPATSALLIMDSDNLTFRDRISIPENMVGRAILNKAANMMYAISESGVMLLPVGVMNDFHRVAASQEDMLMLANFCNRNLLSQSLTITDPGGGATDFAITTSQPGITISPAAGITPLTVQISVDPTVIPALGGTTAITLSLTSKSAVNQPKPVRLLVNNPDPAQRGTIVDQPGILTDIMPDQARNRIYVLRQDMNQLLVFDGSSMNLIAKLRTATTPTTMAITSDGNYLLVGHDDSSLLNIYDLNALQPAPPIMLPPGHYARSIAASNTTLLALARNEANGTGIIDSIDLNAGAAAPLPTLGVFSNSVSPTGVLGSSPGGGNILYASPDGTVALYTASAGTFVTSRKDFSSLSGAFAASDYNSFVIGNAVFDAALVPAGVVSVSPLLTSGFTFVDQGGYMASAASSSAAGSLLRVASMTKSTATPVLTSEAPLLSVAATSSPSSTGGTSSSAAPVSIYGTYGSGESGNHSSISFRRTVAPMASSGTVFMLSTSGITMLASSSAASSLQPSITGITNAANGTSAVAPGGLISIYGQNLTGASASTSGAATASLPANSCIGLNGLPIPLLYVSPQQINGQLPFNISGSATLTIHTPGGTSNNYVFPIQPTAPSIFMSASAGPQTGLATIVRDNNNQLVTATNPIFPKDTLTIYLTGMGQTVPQIQAGQPAPANPLSLAAVQPVVTLGGTSLSVLYAGLAPGEVGVDQINVVVPFAGVPPGLAIPLVITQGGASTTLNVRVVD